MKLRLGDTVIEVEYVAYAKKISDYRVDIYFVGLNEPLKVRCGPDEVDKTKYIENADSLISKIESHKKEKDITFSSRIG